MEFYRRPRHTPTRHYVIGMTPFANDPVVLAERRNELRWAYINRYLRSRGKTWSQLSNYMQMNCSGRKSIVIFARGGRIGLK